MVGSGEQDIYEKTSLLKVLRERTTYSKINVMNFLM